MISRYPKKNIINGVFICFFIIFFIIAYIFFEKYNYNDYKKAEYYTNKTKFTRDFKEKNGKHNSYKLYSKEFNDAMFYKEIRVEKNKPYKITCMIKTKDIQSEKNSSNSGAQICVFDTTEKSKALTGTNDWQKVELLLDSKDRDKIKIGFRLGGYDDNCKRNSLVYGF